MTLFSKMKLPAIKVYWLSWAGITCGALGLKMMLFLVAPKFDTSSFFIVYLVGVWLPIVVLNFLEGKALAPYVKKAQACGGGEVSELIGQGESWSNRFKMMSFLFSTEDFGDREFLMIKLRYRSFLKFALFALLSFPIVAGLLSL